MNNIYVDELPKDCSECPMCRSGNLKLQKKGRYIEAKQCVFGQYKYQTIDDEIDTCPLKPLSDRLAEERMMVCDAVYKLTRELMSFGYGAVSLKEVEKVLEKFDRGE